MKSLNELLIGVLNDEMVYQQEQDHSQSEAYRKASAYHNHLIEHLLEEARLYPHFIVPILKDHIQREEAVFGDPVQEELTDTEKGRIYSLVRCRHMLRIAREQSQNK